MEHCSYCLQPGLVTPVGRGQLKTCAKCKPYIPEFSTRTEEIDNSIMEPQILMQSSNQQLNIGTVLHCPLCNKTFERTLQYQNHMRNHRAERKFVCPHCDKAFSQSNNLRAHLRIHNNERPYKCVECGKAFTQVTNLNNHLRLHTGERPFACTEPGCDKAFAQVTNLNNHKKCHQKDKESRSFQCEICQSSFKFRSHLTMHRATHGPVRGRPPLSTSPVYHVCKDCGESFENERQLKKHIKENCSERFVIKQESYSEESIKCLLDDCHAYFNSNDSLKNHLSRDHQLPISLDKPKSEVKSENTRQSHFIKNIMNRKSSHSKPENRSVHWQDNEVPYSESDDEDNLTNDENDHRDNSTVKVVIKTE